MSEEASVRVALRIRPQLPREIFDMCHVCTTITPGEPQVWMGNDKAFTFDHVFSMTSAQETIYNSCIQDLIDGCLKGYNATILAYGQTGSGKTYTMGTGFDVNIIPEERGIIPRAVNHLYEEMARKQNEAQNKNLTPPDFKVVVQFMELYNEDMIDLLEPGKEGDDKSKKSFIKIHEDSTGQIYTAGLTSRTVTSANETLQCLKIGALSRTTASTQMNSQSSRSHAIFTLHIKQQRIIHFENTDDLEDGETLEEFETLTSKLHFVDLAGSERLKRTGATGERAREGISINYGLLSLGNVISALGDKSKRATHVPYRDSKLTRLLQDSLGGNSQTLMIACVSPSDRDFMETLNTLHYANRAKNIKNKISINQDKSSQTISLLRREIQQLQLELVEYKQGKRLIGEDGHEQVNDMFHENTLLQTENNNLRSRLKASQETLDHQTRRITELLAEKATGNWITTGDQPLQSDITDLIKGYLQEIEDMRVKLLQSEEECSQLHKQIKREQARLSLSSRSGNHDSQYHSFENSSSSVYDVIIEAKQDIKNLKKRAKALKVENAGDNSSKEEFKQSIDDEKESEDVSEMNGDVDEEEDDDESSDESDSEEKSAAEAYSSDLAELTWDISMKQRLIEALEQSQQRLHTMRHHYEEKLHQLEQRIKDTVLERDRVLANLSGVKGNKSEEKVKKVKLEYEKKLSNLQGELKKMQIAKKEHAQLMKNQALYERQVQQLKNEVSEMKKTKVKLINKMKDDNHRHVQAEQRRAREIAQLKKQGRVKENQIRTLEAEKRMKENVLKRKQEELTALRKVNKPMSYRVAGRVPQSNDPFFMHRRAPFSPKVAKSRWQSLEKSINKLVISKQSIYNIEKDMEHYLKERERLNRSLEQLKEKRNSAILEKKSPATIQDYEDNIENLKVNIDYCQGNISDCQTTIVQMEEAKGDIDVLDADKLVQSMNVHESKYLLSKLINMSINQTFQVFQKDGTIKEMEEKLRQSTDSNVLHFQLIERLFQEGKIESLEFMPEDLEPACESQCSTRSSSPVDSSVSEVSNVNSSSDHRRIKRPRKTLVPSECLMYSPTQTNITPAGSCPSVADEPEKPSLSKMAWSLGPSALKQELDIDENDVPSSQVKQDHGIVRVTSAPTSLQEMAYGKKFDRSPYARRKVYDNKAYMGELSPAFRRKFNNTASVIPLPSLSRQSSTETTVSDITPPNSPSNSRKFREDNVFSRLTCGSFRLNKPGSGTIVTFSSKMNLTRNSPLMCTHTAEGHSRAVLSLTATDDVLFSSSKDRTVKIWDLASGKEIQSLGGHPNNVCAVRYSEYSRLAFSVSTAFIKVWDVRENPAKCVQTLSSSGATNSGTPTLNTPSRTLLMPQGETQIHDIALNRYGTTLFSAASNIVRIWDLRMYKAIGKLSGSHQAAIMCLAVDNEGTDKNVVVTGSKDHYIKVFEVTEGLGGLHMAKTNLKPPHYDGIQSLAINGHFLFSGSRDMCIKKWNLKSGNHIQSLNQAHKDWVCALSFLSTGSLLLSGCRGGFLKLWAADSTQLLGEIKAHSAPINSIATNNSCIFTASSDCTVGIWRLKNNNDLSPDNNDCVEV